MVTPTCIVGVFLFLSIGFLQVPGTLNGDSSTFCVRFVRLDLPLGIPEGVKLGLSKNPNAANIRICNPPFALQMLIFNAAELQIRLNNRKGACRELVLFGGTAHYQTTMLHG